METEEVSRKKRQKYDCSYLRYVFSIETPCVGEDSYTFCILWLMKINRSMMQHKVWDTFPSILTQAIPVSQIWRKKDQKKMLSDIMANINIKKYCEFPRNGFSLAPTYWCSNHYKPFYILYLSQHSTRFSYMTYIDFTKQSSSSTKDK